MTKHFGFTLAEVLITLAIIGVVAALTLPALLNSTRGAELKTGFKKEFAALASVPKLSYAHDGTDFSNWDQKATADQLEDNFDVVKRVDDEKDLGLATGEKYGEADLNGAIYLVLNDGAILIVPTGFGPCSYTKTTSDVTLTGDGTDCKLYIDANGVKGPNKIIDETTNTITDIYPVLAGGMMIRPGNAAAQAVFENQKVLSKGESTYDATKIEFAKIAP